MTHDVAPFLPESANDEGENAGCKEDCQKYRLSQRYLALILGQR
jgi:hypothetical protein